MQCCITLYCGEIKMKKVNKIVILAGLSVGILTGIPAQADDDKVYPGSMCDWQTKTSSQISEQRHSLGLRNVTHVSRWTTCPIVRDSETKSPEYASITVWGGTNGSCFLDIRTQNGGGKTNRVHGNIVNLHGGKQRFEWFKGNQDGPNYHNAAYVIACPLKPNSFVYSYSMSEN